jgi:hypothetical protein
VQRAIRLVDDGVGGAVTACGTSEPTAAPTPTATPTLAPTATPALPIVLPGAADSAALRERAEALALAFSKGRFDDSYAMTSPAFQAGCDPDGWLGGLIFSWGFIRAFAGLDDDATLDWIVAIAEARDDEGQVVLRPFHDGRQVDTPSADPWTRIDGEWFFDALPANRCV